MQPEIQISLVIPAGSQVGPFDLYSNVDGYTTPFETGVNASEFLTPGYITTPPDGTTFIRVQSTGSCDTFIDLENTCQPTTTTTTSSSTSTTTTSSTSTTTTTSTSSTTTTTTTIPPTTTTTTSSTSTTTTTTTAPPTTTTTSTTKAPLGYSITAGNFTEAAACSDSFFSTVYVEDNTFAVGNIVYTDSARTNPFTFSVGQYYKVDYPNGATNQIVLQGNASGEITNISTCNVTSDLYISGVQSLCPDFCQNNYTIPTQKTTASGHTFWTLAPGDIIQGATLTAGWYAYANTSTTTNAAAASGLLRMFRIVSGNSVQEISQCSDDNLSCDLQ